MLPQRIWQHKEKIAEGFTKKYGVGMLVWYEEAATIEAAIYREKQLKNWKRQWKLELIEKCNPRWDDLYEAIS